MKPSGGLLRRIPVTVRLSFVAMLLLGNVADAQAGPNASTGGTAANLSLESEVLAAEPCLVAIAVRVSNSDGTPISSLTADLSGLPENNDATFVSDGTNTSGTFIWHPGEALGGQVSFTATANGQSTTIATTFVLAPEINATGVFRWIPTHADLGTHTVTVTAQNSLGEIESAAFPLTVIAQSAPAPTPARSNQTLSAEAPTRGPIISIGTCGQCGGSGAETDTVNVDNSQYLEYFEIYLNVTDPEGVVSLTADFTDLPPNNTATFSATLGATAKAGGPYSGVVGVPVDFDGSASSGGDFPLDLAWDFGDSWAGSGVKPSHVYTAAGTYLVTMVANAPPVSTFPNKYSDCDAASVVIRDALPARAFIADGHRSTPGTPSSRSLCIQIEPVDGAYDNAQVDLSTIRMYSDASGSSTVIRALGGKTTFVEDRDRNGIQEIAACFSRADLHSLLEGDQTRKSLPVIIAAEIETGATLRAALNLHLVDAGQSLSASVHPNPLRQTGTLTVEALKPGRLEVLLFDLHGRLVRTLLNQPQAARGRYEIPIDRRDGQGRSLGTGVYFYQVRAAETVATGRLMILR